jgi:TDG/mug DNA glycosylase family protein
MGELLDLEFKTCFGTVADEETRVLVLGTLPGAISLAQGRYYANPTNQFWRLIGPVIGVGLTVLDYEDRLAALLESRVGLWDVMASASRQGSLDSAIRAYDANALGVLAVRFPNLQAFAFNGGKAYQIGRRQMQGAPVRPTVPCRSRQNSPSG